MGRGRPGRNVRAAFGGPAWAAACVFAAVTLGALLGGRFLLALSLALLAPLPIVEMAGLHLRSPLAKWASRVSAAGGAALMVVYLYSRMF